MQDYKVTLKSGADFVQHSPIELSYSMSFLNRTDALSFELQIYDKLNFAPEEEFTFYAKANDGNSFTFTGLLYSVQRLSDNFHLRLHFVSKYYLKLVSMLPLYGKGSVSNIIKSFYAKADVPKSVVDSAETSYDNILFPRNYTVDDAIRYLLNRTVAEDKGMLMATVVGDTAYIRNNKKGTTEIEGLLYDVLGVKDNRKKVDVDGGLSLDALSDLEESAKVTYSFPGKKAATLAMFLSYDNFAMTKARADSTNRKIYYNNYIADLSVNGWPQLIGSSITVKNKQDGDIMNQIAVPVKYLVQGVYFIFTQVLNMSFSQQKDITQCTAQLVKEIQL